MLKDAECFLYMERKIKVLIAKIGLDGHDRGTKIVARALRDAGIEVVYTGLHQTPEMIANAAIQEDVDIVGLSIHSGAHMTLFPKVVSLLKEQGNSRIQLIAGGIIPDEDIQELLKIGFKHIFTPGTSTQDIIAEIHKITSEMEQPAI